MGDGSGERTCLSIVLAAGEGTRMRSDLPKVVHPVAGLPMVVHVLRVARMAGAERHAVVVGAKADQVRAALAGAGEQPSLYEQTERLGTAHAVLSARAAIEQGADDIVVLNGDVPLIRTQTIAAAREALADGADIVALGFRTQDPTGYGRMLERDGRLHAIREHKDATEEERAVSFCNSGIMAFRGEHALALLDAIGNDNVQGEYYLPDAIEIANVRGLDVRAVEVPEEDTLGVNDRVQLAGVEAIWQRRRRETLMRSGVSMTMPESVVLHHDTELAADCVVEPYTVFGPRVFVDRGARIRAFSHLEDARVGADCEVGPYARLRPGSVLERGAKIGNFVEVKKSRFGEGAKANHLAYVGDAQIGAGANIGAGTITCNYDGANKHSTEVGAGAFIGTNTSLVAPVSIGAGAITAAGSVITSDVPNDALALGRARQANKPGLGRRIRERNLAIKAAAKGEPAS